MGKILVGMSGGIDSTVTAYLLKKAGHQVTGVTMSIWKNNTHLKGHSGKNACFSPDEKEDIEKTAMLCKKIGIEYKVLDISDTYQDIVLDNFKDEYLHGRTPNPCVWCNQKIKFGAMVEEARKAGLDFDFFATGHYARIVSVDGRYAIKKAADMSKDQSYFLYRLNQTQLSEIMFPLGNLTKKEVRKIDLEMGFHSESQTESQDFYSGDYTDLLGVESKKGEIVDSSGNVLGYHNGFWNYTIGQRKGLGIAYKEPLYVISLNAEKNQVLVGTKVQTFNKAVVAGNVVFSGVKEIKEPIKAFAKIRSVGRPAECMLQVLADGFLKADFTEPVYSATPGQSLVAYNEDGVILCGGIIDKVL